MNLLAFDLGAESGRAVLGTLEGARLRVEEVHRFANVPIRENGHLFWDLPAIWTDLRAALTRAAARPETPDGIAVDTWGVDYGLLTSDGNYIGRPYHYRDARTDGVMESVLARVGRERVYQSTGIQFLQFNSLFQLAAHVQEQPRAIAEAEQLLFMPDLFRYGLAGTVHTEPTIASTSQMYDPNRHEWAEDLLDELTIPRRLLPRVLPTGTRAELCSGLVTQCGFRRTCPVISTTGHDTAAAVVAVPAVDGDNWCYISSGTWSLMGVELDRPIINGESLRHNFTNEVGFGNSIRFLRNIMGLWLVQECRREMGSDLTYEQLTRLAADARGCDAVIDPDHKPFLSPGDMCAKIARFCRDTRQAPPVDGGQMIRCCLESLALMYRRTLGCLEELTGKRIDTIHVVGGGSRNELLNQMTADACGRRVVAGPVEATAIGNLLVQALSLESPDAGAAVALKCHGREALARARRIVSNSFDVTRYEPTDPAPWNAKYERFGEVAGA